MIRSLSGLFKKTVNLSLTFLSLIRNYSANFIWVVKFIAESWNAFSGTVYIDLEVVTKVLYTLFPDITDIKIGPWFLYNIKTNATTFTTVVAIRFILDACWANKMITIINTSLLKLEVFEAFRAFKNNVIFVNCCFKVTNWKLMRKSPVTLEIQKVLDSHLVPNAH